MRRLHKTKRGEMICGVCAGLAETLNVDPTLIRLLFIFATLFCDVGILLYIILALILPTE